MNCHAHRYDCRLRSIKRPYDVFLTSSHTMDAADLLLRVAGA